MPSFLDRFRRQPAAAAGQIDPAPIIAADQGAVQQQQINYGSENELVQYVNQEYRRRQEERRPFENQWRLNINFIQGNQYMQINPVTQALEEIPKMYWWQEREVFNHVAPNVEVRLAKMSRMRPILKVRPGSNEPQDVRATKVGSHLLQTIYYDKKMKAKQADVNAWCEATGTCLIKNTWNPEAGKLIGYQAIIDPSSGQVTGQQEIREGDLDSVVCPPQEIFPDSCYHQETEDCRSILHAKAFHIDEIEETWDKKVEPEEVAVAQLQRSMVGTGGLGYGQIGDHSYGIVKMKDHALVKELWERPSKKYPQGRLIIIASNKLLYAGPLPYRVGENGAYTLPFTKQVCIKVPGIFFGKAVTERLIPLQRRYNALRNRKAEYLNRAAIGQYSVEEDSVNIDEFEENAGSPGYISQRRAGSQPPTPIQTPPLPAAFETELSELLQEFSILSGVSEISRQSNAPTGVKSGVALQLAMEQDDTRLSSTIANIEDSILENGKQWLRLYKQFAQGYRTLRSIGKNNVVELMDFTASDLSSDDVLIEPYSANAESPAQRRQMVFDLLQSGLLTDPDTGRMSKDIRAQVLDMIELGNWEMADDADGLHIARAERENFVMKQGQPALPVDYDDHILHVQRHTYFRLTVEYEELISQSPVIQQVFEEHLNIHLQYMAGMMAGQQQSVEQKQAG